VFVLSSNLRETICAVLAPPWMSQCVIPYICKGDYTPNISCGPHIHTPCTCSLPCCSEAHCRHLPTLLGPAIAVNAIGPSHAGNWACRHLPASTTPGTCRPRHFAQQVPKNRRAGGAGTVATMRCLTSAAVAASGAGFFNPQWDLRASNFGSPAAHACLKLQAASARMPCKCHMLILIALVSCA